ncbi:MAG TPA: C4-type zinc ribbon domain-containing protein [Acidimicrobiales bacterium]
MTDTLDHLLAVQDLDIALTQLQHRRDALAQTSGLAEVETQIAALEAERQDATTRRTVLTDTQKNLEEQIARISERRSVLEQRMYAARGTSARDLQAMSEEVRHLTQRRADLEEMELAAMLDQDPIDAELAALDERMAPLRAQADELRTQVNDAARTIDADIATTASQRTSEARQLPTALSDRYETLRARLKGTGAARLIGNRCDGCHLELSSMEVEKIRAIPPGEVATCEQCGRILVPV